MNKIMKLPISVVWVLLMLIVFTFVEPTWIFETFLRGAFCVISIIGGGLLTGMNGDLGFWEYHE